MIGERCLGPNEALRSYAISPQSKQAYKRRMTRPPLRTRFVLAALIIMLAAGFADWGLLAPDSPLEAFLDVAIAGGSAAAALLPFMLS